MSYPDRDEYIFSEVCGNQVLPTEFSKFLNQKSNKILIKFYSSVHSRAKTLSQLPHFSNELALMT